MSAKCDKQTFCSAIARTNRCRSRASEMDCSISWRVSSPSLTWAHASFVCVLEASVTLFDYVALSQRSDKDSAANSPTALGVFSGFLKPRKSRSRPGWSLEKGTRALTRMRQAAPHAHRTSAQRMSVISPKASMERTKRVGCDRGHFEGRRSATRNSTQRLCAAKRNG